MHTTSGLLMFLSQRLGAVGLPILALLAVAVAVATGLTVFAISEFLVATADPVQVAPLRWGNRHC